jgi:benzoyl-CoA reductase/2-hydroxyglutaryl-CoA dehydratase subunit BcrC/BadD/HgdB
VAWITSGGPVELLIAMDVIPIYPENHAAMCGVTRMAVDLCEVSEQMGYSRDICSYARTDIGSAVTGGGPIMGLPKPDFLVCCNNICGSVTKWYEVLARLFDVPLIFIDTPFIHDELTDNALAYVKGQMAHAIKQMETIVGKKFDMDRFTEVAKLSAEASGLWSDVLAMGRTIPAPLSSFDGFILMAPIVTLRGQQKVLDFYRGVKKEIEERVAEGVAAVPGEKYRLMWDNLPIWFKMRDLSEKFIDHQACVVASTYLNGWAAASALDATTDPLGGLARAYATAFINQSIQSRARLIEGVVRDCSVDGIIFHSNRSCRPYSFGQYDIKEMLTERTGVPGILIEADMNDERSFSEGPAFTRIEAFIETLQPRREVAV